MAEKKQPKINFYFKTSLEYIITTFIFFSYSYTRFATNHAISSPDPITEPTDITDITDIFDIACCTNKLLSHYEKADILNKIWKPDLNYNLSIKTSVVGKK